MLSWCWSQKEIKNDLVQMNQQTMLTMLISNQP